MDTIAHKLWVRNNRDKVRGYLKKYRSNNLEKVRERNRLLMTGRYVKRKPVQKKCGYCGKEFSGRPSQKYCCHQCQSRKYYGYKIQSFTRQCKTCGKQFQTEINYPDKIFCSNICTQNYYYRMKVWGSVSLGKRNCIICGKEISLSRRDTKFCSNRCREYELYWRNPQKRLFKSKTRYARLNKIVHDFSFEDWVNLKKQTDGICPMCHKVVGIDKLTKDHIFPVSKAEQGRRYTIKDMQPLCGSCNSRKQNRLIL